MWKAIVQTLNDTLVSSWCCAYGSGHDKQIFCIVENSISLCDHLWFARASGPPYLRENGNLSMRENLVMTSPYVRPYVHKFFPLSLREFCPVLFQTEQVVGSFYTGAVHLTFEGVMGDFSKKSCRLISRRKVCKEIPGKNNILHWKKRFRSWSIMLKKSYTVVCRGKNF